MNGYGLPTSVTVRGQNIPIRTDYRAVLDVLAACADPALDGGARAEVMLRIMFPDRSLITEDNAAEALAAAVEFIDCGRRAEAGAPRLFDWEADAELIVPAVNKIAGGDVRALPYLHWWSFLSYFFEIGDSLFASVLRIRQKRASGARLDAAEAEFYRENRRLFGARPEASTREEEEILKWL